MLSDVKATGEYLQNFVDLTPRDIKTVLLRDTVQQTSLRWLPSGDVEPFLLTWFKFNSSMDKYLHPLQYMRWNYLPISKLQRWNHWSLGMDE